MLFAETTIDRELLEVPFAPRMDGPPDRSGFYFFIPAADGELTLNEPLRDFETRWTRELMAYFKAPAPEIHDRRRALLVRLNASSNEVLNASDEVARLITLLLVNVEEVQGSVALDRAIDVLAGVNSATFVDASIKLMSDRLTSDASYVLAGGIARSRIRRLVKLELLRRLYTSSLDWRARDGVVRALGVIASAGSTRARRILTFIAANDVHADVRNAAAEEWADS